MLLRRDGSHRESDHNCPFCLALATVFDTDLSILQDNFPHDLVRYSMDDLRPYQAVVTIDDNGDFSELYEPVNDPLILQFLQYREEVHHPSTALSSPVLSWPSLRSLYRAIPFSPNLTPKPEFLPTQLLSMLKILRQYFPQHRLLLSDFSSLPDTVPGFTAPVVQTRYRGTMVPVETYMVQQGYFDIFFPTSFELLRRMYGLVMSKPLASLQLRGGGKEKGRRPRAPSREGEEQEVFDSSSADDCSKPRLGSNFFVPHDGRSVFGRAPTGMAVEGATPTVYTHQEFMRSYADLDKTRLRNGENPLLDYYQNVKVIF